MPLLRINATSQGLAVQGSPQSASTALAMAAMTSGPVVIMVHGYKYSPQLPTRCPHKRIFHRSQWPQSLGLTDDDTLVIAFGWHARGGLSEAYQTALEHARELAQIIGAFQERRQVSVIAHSLGATLALGALPYLSANAVERIVLLSGAAHLGLARHALATPAGRSCTLFHVTSGENALFDHAFEYMVSGSGAIGRGIGAANSMRLHIDCPETLETLRAMGYPLAPPQRRICHWSSYTRQGVMHFNAALLSGAVSMPHLRSALPTYADAHHRVWSLATLRKTRIMASHHRGKGPRHEHIY